MSNELSYRDWPTGTRSWGRAEDLEKLTEDPAVTAGRKLHADFEAKWPAFKLALQAGFRPNLGLACGLSSDTRWECLEPEKAFPALFALVAEECAKACDRSAAGEPDVMLETKITDTEREVVGRECAAAIRAMFKATP